MKYETIRDTINSGDLILFRPTTLVGKIIHFFAGGTWTHCGVAWSYMDRKFLLDSDEYNGTSLSDLSLELPFVLVRTSAHINWDDAHTKLALEQMGLPYSFWDAIKAWLKLSLSYTNRMCTTYVVQLLDPSYDGYMMPNDLGDYLIKKYNETPIDVDK